MPSGQAESAEFAEKRRGRKSRTLHCGQQKKRRPPVGMTAFGTCCGVEKRRRDRDNAETQRTPSRAEERKRLLVKIILTLGGGSCDRTATDFGLRGLRKELIERRVQKKRRIQ